MSGHNVGNVASFACARPHPELGDEAPCMRSRHHPGDHRTQHGDQLKVWCDPPAPLPTAEGLLTSLRATHDPAPLDEDTEQWRGVGLSPLDRALVTLVWVVVVAIVTGWPILLYRWVT